MVNNQSWFGSNFRNERKIKLIGENFQGELLIESYPRLEELYFYQVKSTKNITIRNLSQLKKCTIWGCGLADLIIDNCPKIKKLNVRSNLLTSLEFLKNLENLEELDLDISCNNFSSDLEPFSRIIGMSKLNISNLLGKKVLLRKYNQFHDSLIHLRSMNKLEELDISNTDIDKGLEHLPESLKKIVCSNDLVISLIKGGGGNKCSEIIQRLKKYQISSNCYSLDDWRQQCYCEINDERETNRALDNILLENNFFLSQLGKKEEFIAQIQQPPK